MLLSSQLIFNTTGLISDNSLEDLSILQLLTNEMRLNAKETTEESSTEDEDEDEDNVIDAQNFQHYFPNFTWVLRDVSMDFKHLTPKSYLMNGLEEERDPKRGSAEEAARRNVIRKSIKSYFGGEKNIECFPMTRPVDDDSKLESLDVCKKAYLKPDFVKTCEDLLINLKNRLKIK